MADSRAVTDMLSGEGLPGEGGAMEAASGGFIHGAAPASGPGQWTAYS